MNISPRQLAVEILNRVDGEAAHAEPLLDAALSGKPFANPHDRGLLTELVYGTLRIRARLDWIITSLYRGDIDGLDMEIRNILRTALYQLWFTDRIPSFAAVNEAVGLAKTIRPAASGLVNAILRNALRKKDAIVWPDIATNPEAAISVLHSHPAWLVRRLLGRFGVEETVALCRENNAQPPLTLRVNTLKASRQEVLSSLAKDDITAELTTCSADGLRITSPAPGLRETKSWQAGLIRIQDEASQLVSYLVGPQPGENILDLCAGAGGKTLHLATLMANRGRLTALDRDPGKLRMLREDADRLGVTIVQTRTGDAATLPETFQGTFDRVLLDAPCSGLGTLRRNPEIRWRIAPADIDRCMRTQQKLLKGAADCVKPGGRLVYSVCTITPEENETVITDLLRYRNDFRVGTPDEVPTALIDAEGFFRSSPHAHGMDAFFATILVRDA